MISYILSILHSPLGKKDGHKMRPPFAVFSQRLPLSYGTPDARGDCEFLLVNASTTSVAA